MAGVGFQLRQGKSIVAFTYVICSALYNGVIPE